MSHMKDMDTMYEAQIQKKDIAEVVAANDSRDQVIIRTSFIGIAANAVLAGVKIFIGLITNSIAITLDAVNNVSDAASSIITIVGTKLAAKEADKKHPFGYGRVEYLTSMIISLIILYAGITAFMEAFKAILNPETAEYTTPTLIVVAIGVGVKFLLGRYFIKTGERVKSDSLVASGSEASLDSVVSLSTLIAAFIYVFMNISLEAWLGAIISILIAKSGAEMLWETISKILGERADVELSKDIKATVNTFENVHGAYDLVLNNYGPDNYNGSIHIEIPDTLSANEVDNLIRNIQTTVYAKHGVILTAIGIYAENTKNDKAKEIETRVREIVLGTEFVKQMHGFYLDEDIKTIRFDAVISFDSPNRRNTYMEVIHKTKEAFPDYEVVVALDIDYTEL